MSTPVADRNITQRGQVAGRARTVTIPAQRIAPPAAVSTPDPVPRTAASRAYARREDRMRRLGTGRTPASAGRAQFVLMVMVLLGTGLVATLWLSTAAVADSYRLQDARVEESALLQQSERLHREVAAMDSAPMLAQRAGELGMIPVQDPARLVVTLDGAVEVVGDAVPVEPPLPPPPVPAEIPGEVAPPEGTAPIDGTAEQLATAQDDGTALTDRQVTAEDGPVTAGGDGGAGPEPDAAVGGRALGGID